MPKFRRSSHLGRMKLTQAKKKKTSKGYHLRNIQTLLTQGFTERELRDLCFYEPEFRPLHDQLPQGAGKAEIIRSLLEYAEQKVLLDALLDLAKKHNPARYKKHQPYVIISPTRLQKDNR
ncbi:MAG: hypothetical protein HYR94_05475 [Chloroflexi bacterium]|nr:hypothetical protein [Chloroflexota bacterium]